MTLRDRFRKHWNIVEDTKPEPQENTDFEAYLTNRIFGKNSRICLDNLELDEVSRGCEALGMLIEKGSTANVEILTERQKAEYGQLGFEVFQNGPSAVKDTIESMLQTRGTKSRALAKLRDNNTLAKWMRTSEQH